ncbi:MAG: ornithine carbamoyltransferase [Phylliscum demangeonii]|nr:MAG: ornithine carbamoyltransferase [Phylliscum demangeonii]
MVRRLIPPRPVSWAFRGSGGQRPRHLLSIADLSEAELAMLVSRARYYKNMIKMANFPERLRGRLCERSVALMFSKRSTRTRLSSEAAIVMLGGHPIFLGKDDIQLGVNESLRDTASVLGSMMAGVVARVDAHGDVVEVAQHSAVPVINALSDRAHPLQTIADCLTMLEATVPNTVFDLSTAQSAYLQGVKVAWVGDANNVLFDLILGAKKLGLHVAVATPPGYGIPDHMRSTIAKGGNWGSLTETHKPEEAVHLADFIVTDTWVSMGQEAERAKRLRDFKDFQVTADLARSGGAHASWKLLHCLPRHAEEVTDEVFYGPRSLVFHQAENRLWAALAVFEAFFVHAGQIIPKNTYQDDIRRTPKPTDTSPGHDPPFNQIRIRSEVRTYNQESERTAYNRHARRRSANSLRTSSLTPLTPKLPLPREADDDDHDHDTEHDLPSTAHRHRPRPPRHPHPPTYLHHQSAPVTPSILSRTPSRHGLRRLQAQAEPGADNGWVRKSQSSSQLLHLPASASASASALAAGSRRGGLQPLSSPLSPPLPPPPSWSSSAEWLLRAGAVLSAEARESKGQSWLVSRASSTSLVRDGREEDEENEEEEENDMDGGGLADDEDSPVSTRPSRGASRVASRQASRFGSRLSLTSTSSPHASRSRGGGDMDIDQNNDDDDAAGAGRRPSLGPGPDFINSRDRAEIEEAAAARRGGGIASATADHDPADGEHDDDDDVNENDEDMDDAELATLMMGRRVRVSPASSSTTSLVAAWCDRWLWAWSDFLGEDEGDGDGGGGDGDDDDAAANRPRRPRPRRLSIRHDPVPVQGQGPDPDPDRQLAPRSPLPDPLPHDPDPVPDAAAPAASASASAPAPAPAPAARPGPVPAAAPHALDDWQDPAWLMSVASKAFFSA